MGAWEAANDLSVFDEKSAKLAPDPFLGMEIAPDKRMFFWIGSGGCMSKPFTVLLHNASETGSAMDWAGGLCAFAVVGTLEGATVSLQFLDPDASLWFDVSTDMTMTAAGVAVCELPAGKIRAHVSGGTPSGLFAGVSLVPEEMALP